MNNDAIFNSTAKNSAEILHADTDLSSISNIGFDFVNDLLSNTIVQNTNNQESNTLDLPVNFKLVREFWNFIKNWFFTTLKDDANRNRNTLYKIFTSIYNVGKTQVKFHRRRGNLFGKLSTKKKLPRPTKLRPTRLRPTKLSII